MRHATRYRNTYRKLVESLLSFAKTHLEVARRSDSSDAELEEFRNTDTSGFRKLDRLSRWKVVQRMAHPSGSSA